MLMRLLYLVIFMVVIDLINHFGLKAMLKRIKDSYFYKYNIIAYWSVAFLMAIVLLISLLITGYPQLDYEKYRFYFYLFAFWLVFYLPRFVFSFFVVLQTIYYLLKNIRSRKGSYTVRRNIKRSYVVQKAGLTVGFLTFLIVIYGILIGKSDFKVTQIEIELAELPAAFDGFRIAQFSDAHLGSFSDTKIAEKGFQILQNQKPDMIVFTGDMVNNIADEIEPYFVALSKLEAPYGKFSILGNHDMSDYVKWKNFDLKREYLLKLIRYQERCGFQVLENENILIRKGDAEIALIGVNNWGLPPFKPYGDLHKAMSGVENSAVKILLSHDPSHWKEQVLAKTDIDLTLSGHTHGAQMGIILPFFKWSPVQYIYTYWHGLYHINNQHLYVNPGFGYIGFPGRIGMRPEITIFTLKKKYE